MANHFISISGLKKTFRTPGGEVQILKGIDLDIARNDIFGIIGLSGAGKSTLLRCINRLEEPDEGEILLNGVDILSLSKNELNLARKRIGMIFQAFHLFESKTVFQNVAYPLKQYGIPNAEQGERVTQLLALVGLAEKSACYPSQLSGGQKQRVGIARALACNPEVLLCDEATSSLDPQTTLSILDLLKDINKQLNLTILMVTHELEVIKYACNNVAIIEDGVIVESGDINQVMKNPLSHTGNIFVNIEKKLRERWLTKDLQHDF